jgi:hypothetical protein
MRERSSGCRLHQSQTLDPDWTLETLSPSIPRLSPSFPKSRVALSKQSEPFRVCFVLPCNPSAPPCATPEEAKLIKCASILDPNWRCENRKNIPDWTCPFDHTPATDSTAEGAPAPPPGEQPPSQPETDEARAERMRNAMDD